MATRAVRVDHPSKLVMDPDDLPWTTRLKYVETRELLEDYQHANMLSSREDCPITAYLAEHIDDDILEVTDTIFSHPDWGPVALTVGLWETLRLNHDGRLPHGDAISRWVQHYYCLTLRKKHPFDVARPALAKCLYHPLMRWVSSEAAYVMLAYIAEGHPNPRRWLQRPPIRAKFPMLTDDEIARFAAPDFEPQPTSPPS